MPEISLDAQKAIHTPLDMIKLNMKTEFLLVWLSIPYSLYLLWEDMAHVESKSIFIAMNIVSTAVLIYFFWRLLSFYKRFSRITPNTNYDLFTLKTELLVTKEIFLSYYVLYIPLVFLTYLFTIGFHLENDAQGIMFTCSFGLSVIIILLIRKYWLHYMYGIYINQIVEIIDELNGINHIEIERGVSLYEKSQRYFISRWGLIGNILFVILWACVWGFLFFGTVFILTLVVLLGGIIFDVLDKESTLNLLQLLQDVK